LDVIFIKKINNMKTNILKALFGLILTFTISGIYAQSPRIRLNQIVKDSITGSVLISGADSNMVYSRDFYIGSDTSLVFYGTTIVAGGGGGGSFVTLPQLTDSLALYATKVELSDSMATVLKQVATDLTLTGTGTDASPLKVDTSVIATVAALRDSLAGILTTVSTDNTLTGNGLVASPLKVDTTIIGTKGDLGLYLPLTGGTLTGNLTGTTSSFSSSGSGTTLQVNHSSGSGVGVAITKGGNGEGLTVNKTSGSGNAATITGTLEATTLVKTGGTSSEFLKANGTTDNSTYLTGNQTITLSGDATGSGTTAITVTVVDDSHNHIISNVDNLQDSLNSRMVTDFSNVSGTLPIANGGTGSTTQNFVDLSSAQTVGGAKTFTSTVTGTRFDPTSSSATGNGMYLPATNTLGFSTNGSERMTLDASGNLGLGVTPSAWLSTVKAIQFGGAGSVFSIGNTNNTFLSSNEFINASGDIIYINSTFATRYQQFQGSHRWLNAPSGTAGNAITFTLAMILDASGRLGIGVTSPTAVLHLKAGTASAETAPLKFTSGTNLTAAEAGAMEWNGTNLFLTNSSATRQTIAQGLTGSATLDFGSISANSYEDLTVTVTGAADGDVVAIGVPNGSVANDVIFTAWVSAANTVTIRATNNNSSTSRDPASGTFKAFVYKF
jgi:hypothetical protein